MDIGGLAAGRQLQLDGAHRGAGVVQSIALPSPGAGNPLVHVAPGDWWERILNLTYTITTSAVAAVRTPVYEVLNGDGTVLAAVPASPLLLATRTCSVAARVGTLPQLRAAGAAYAYNIAAAPTAGAQIAFTPALRAGLYEAQVTTAVYGTVSTTETNNMNVATQAANTVVQMVNPAVASPFVNPVVQLWANESDQIIVRAIATATAGSTYSALIAASLIGASPYPVELPDMIVRSGYSVRVIIQGGDAGDTITGAQMVVQRVSSNYAAHGLVPWGQDALRATQALANP